MRRALLPLLALLALASCDSAAPPPGQAAHPALWVVRDADTTIYLFGAVHVLKPGIGWFEGGVKRAFDASDSLVLELVLPPDPEMQALVTRLGTAPPGSPPLSDQLPASEAQAIHAALPRFGMAADALEHVDPWLAATTLSVAPLRALGYAQENGVEPVLTAAAGTQHKPVIGLETAPQQLGYLDALPADAQRRLLIATIDDLPRAGPNFEAVLAAWRSGDADRLAALLNDDLKDSPELTQALLIQRNRNWANWIAARMRQPGTVFVAVGAGHLAGPESVQAMLAAQGLRAERVAN